MKIHKTSRFIPFGYQPSLNNPLILEPVASELEALGKAFEYLDARHPFRKIAQWIESETGRHIAPSTLAKKYRHFKEGRVKRPASVHKSESYDSNLPE